MSDEANTHHAARSRRIIGDGGLLLFRFNGVPILLSPSWAVGALVVIVLYAPLVDRLLPNASPFTAWILSAAFAVLLGISVLAHELGHCVVALRLGIPVRRVRLFLLGGLSEVVRRPRQPRDEGWVAAAGPVVSLFFAGLCGILLFIVPAGGSGWLLVAQCAVANLAVGVFNLLPGLPLDGGRMLRAGVWAVSGERSKGTHAAVYGGTVIAAGLLVWALWGIADDSPDKWLRLGVCLVTAWFIVGGARRELTAERRYTWPPGRGLSDIMRPVLQLPAESPVAEAWAAAQGRGVVLVRADGVAAGLLDDAMAEDLAAKSPHFPAESAADPIRPETVILISESTDDIMQRVTETAAWYFLVVDDDGQPIGVLHRRDIHSKIRRN